MAVHAERLRQVVAAEGPSASVYFEDTHDTEDAAKQRELTGGRWRQSLAESGAPDTVLAALAKAVHSPPAVGRSGEGLGATETDQLSELGSSPVVPRRADEALPLAAIARGSVLIRTDEKITRPMDAQHCADLRVTAEPECETARRSNPAGARRG
jgi:hypothetical protein